MRAIPQPVLDLCRTLRAHGKLAYIVGGSVRDMHLGRAPRDWDVATDALGAQVANLFPRVNDVGLRHNTVGVLQDGLWIEVTTFRDPGVTLAGDLALRDFTINAVALEPETGRIIDPLGGIDDLQARRLRACGRPADRFSEDPLRMLRAARFLSELDCRPDDAVTAACIAELPRIGAVAPERIRDEWLKLLTGQAVRESLLWADATGLLTALFPAAAAARGVAQNKWHRWDVFLHSVETVAHAVATPDVRLAAFFHDLGKPATRRWRGSDWTFYNHERVSAEIAAADMDRYRFSQEQTKRVVSLVANHMFHYAPEWTDAAVRRFVRRVTPELLEPQFQLREADSAATGIKDPADTVAAHLELRRRIEKEFSAHTALNIGDLAVDGNDMVRLLGKASPHVGVLLRHLLEVVTDDPSANERDRLLRAAELHLKTLR